MPLHDTDAFVLRTYTLKEADKICVFLTRNAGKLRGVARGARRLRSRYGASLEPFTEVSLTYFQQENRDLVSISNCEIVASQFAAGLSSERLGVLHYLAELVSEFIPEHEPNERVYRLVAATLSALRTATNEEAAVLTRYFEIWMLKFAGYWADLKHCGACGAEFAEDGAIWLTAEGSPRCRDCGNGWGDELGSYARRQLQDVLTQSPTNFLTTTRDAGTLAYLGALTTRLISRALERDLKSFDLLNRLQPGNSEVGIQ